MPRRILLAAACGPIVQGPAVAAPRAWPLVSAALAAGFTLGGCSSINDVMAGDKIDYKTAAAQSRSNGLEVPPDLTQLTRDSRYQQTQGSAVSAAAYQAGTAAAVVQQQATTPQVAPSSVGEIRAERAGNERWLHTSQSPEQLWPQIESFWKERGFVLTEDTPAAGVMETDWAENRAKLPQDIVRGTIGKVLDGAYSTGELDKFRTRVERATTGSDIYITHRGMQEVYIGERREQTTWQPRQPDPQLEGELLSRLMLRLGAREEVVKTAGPNAFAATPATGAPRARLMEGQAAATLQVDDGFDRAWRRVGVALDRSGFTVEDRDRTQGVYFVRYVDPALAGKEEPNLFQRLFSFGKKDDLGGLAKYRVSVKSEGDRSNITVLNNQGGPENGEAGKRITRMLLDELK